MTEALCLTQIEVDNTIEFFPTVGPGKLRQFAIELRAAREALKMIANHEPEYVELADEIAQEMETCTECIRCAERNCCVARITVL